MCNGILKAVLSCHVFIFKSHLEIPPYFFNLLNLIFYKGGGRCYILIVQSEVSFYQS